MFPAHSRLLLHAHTNLVALKLAAPLQTVPSHSAYPLVRLAIQLWSTAMRFYATRGYVALSMWNLPFSFFVHSVILQA